MLQSRILLAGRFDQPVYCGPAGVGVPGALRILAPLLRQPGDLADLRHPGVAGGSVPGVAVAVSVSEFPCGIYYRDGYTGVISGGSYCDLLPGLHH